jgi:hypothetical protein
MIQTLMLLAVTAAPALDVRVVKYEGSVNGAITVEVHNATATAQTFDARGMYFVPATDPDHAPQRLGAVGPFRQVGHDQRVETVTIAPGASERLTLDVYCIDSHRPAPNESTPFRVASDRMPVSLSQAITKSAAEKAAPYGGVSASAPAAKAAVQSEVWRNRNAKWIDLDGEGAQEVAK